MSSAIIDFLLLLSFFNFDTMSKWVYYSLHYHYKAKCLLTKMVSVAKKI